MTQLELIEKSVRVSAVEQAMQAAERRIRIRRASQHRYRASSLVQVSPMRRARSGTIRAA